MTQRTTVASDDRMPARETQVYPEMVWVEGGTFRMGSDRHYPEEAPAHHVRVDGFWIDRTPVTNRQFREFVKATGHVTFAEIPPDPNDYPGPCRTCCGRARSRSVRPSRSRTLTTGANGGRSGSAPTAQALWPAQLDRRPGRASGGSRRVPGCRGLRQVGRQGLLAEAEWEFAARGGLDGAEFAWGDEFAPGGRQMANTWQGGFPLENTRLDGYDAPRRSPRSRRRATASTT